MRATLNLPDFLVNEVQKESKQKTKTGAIIIALQEYLRRKKIEDLINLAGKISIDIDLNKIRKSRLK